MRRVDIHLLEASESIARIRLLPSGGPLPPGGALTGTLTGPRCRYSRTLPTTFSVCSVDDTAEVLLTEPCYWNADLPFLYDLRLEVRSENTVLERIEQAIGLRRLAVRGPSIFVDNKRFVFRAVNLRSDHSIDWSAWRDAQLTMCTSNPSDDLVRAAGEHGIWLIAEADTESIALNLRNRPAVALMVVSETILPRANRIPGGPLIAVHQNESGLAIAQVDALIHTMKNISESKRELVGCEVPVLAVRSQSDYTSLAGARIACEQLQRHLAPELSLAGYIV
jgi:hypothetical protein